jgi:K+-sensing histidine kinase KdpD
VPRWARSTASTKGWGPWVVGVAVGVAVAWAFVPLRHHVSNVNAALLLVVAVTAVGLFGRRGPVLVAAVAAALSFDAFDTAPYGTLSIAGSQDLITTLVLVVVGAAGGELALRFSRSRRASSTGDDRLSRVQKAASLVAGGEEAALVVAGVGEEILRLLELEQCCFEAGDPPADLPVVARSGQLVEPVGTLAGDQIALPVWALGQQIGFFRLTVPDGAVLSPQAVAVAVTLADQAGAALAVYEPPRPQPEEQAAGRPGHLRLMH